MKFWSCLHLMLRLLCVARCVYALWAPVPNVRVYSMLYRYMVYDTRYVYVSLCIVPYSRRFWQYLSVPNGRDSPILFVACTELIPIFIGLSCSHFGKTKPEWANANDRECETFISPFFGWLYYLSSFSFFFFFFGFCYCCCWFHD